MRNLILMTALALALTTNSAHAVHFFNSSGASVGQFSEVQCSTNMTCANSGGKLAISLLGAALTGDLTGDGGDQLFGFLQNRVTASTTALTAAQCGSSVINAASVTQPLPEASTVLGCRYTIIVGAATLYTINPDDADQILLLTNAAGDAIQADELGESVTLEAISASEWAPVGAEKGTWSDVN